VQIDVRGCHLVQSASNPDLLGVANDMLEGFTDFPCVRGFLQMIDLRMCGMARAWAHAVEVSGSPDSFSAAVSSDVVAILGQPMEEQQR